MACTCVRACWCYGYYLALRLAVSCNACPSRLSSLMTAANASGFTPDSHKLTQTDSVCTSVINNGRTSASILSTQGPRRRTPTDTLMQMETARYNSPLQMVARKSRGRNVCNTTQYDARAQRCLTHLTVQSSVQDPRNVANGYVVRNVV